MTHQVKWVWHPCIRKRNHKTKKSLCHKLIFFLTLILKCCINRKTLVIAPADDWENHDEIQEFHTTLALQISQVQSVCRFRVRCDVGLLATTCTLTAPALKEFMINSIKRNREEQQQTISCFLTAKLAAVVTSGGGSNSSNRIPALFLTLSMCVNINSWWIQSLPSCPHQGAHATHRLFTQSAGQDSQAHSNSA